MSALTLTSWLAHAAYNLVLRLGTPAYLWRIWRRGQVEPGYHVAWPQRLGFYDADYRQACAAVTQVSAPLLWVHAVSLGEARAATPLIQALRVKQPGMRLLLTHSTATGREAGKVLLQPGDIQTWLPFDTPGAVRRFLRLHRPCVGVLMETEVWPNVQAEARRAGVPMVLANARLSEKSLRQGQRLAVLMRPAVSALSLVLAQTADDARRLSEMGAPKVEVCGNVKFDMTPAAELIERGQAWRQASDRPLVLAASTREGEEIGLLQAWQRRQETAGVQPHRLFLVPRHPQRFDEVAALIVSQGLSLSRRSQWPKGMPDAQALVADVWLGDSMGEMPAYYASAKAALLGGSFAPLGGQNLIESAACACPIVMGPSTFNFADAAELAEQAGAAFRVPDWEAGVQRSLSLTPEPLHTRLEAAALMFAQAHRGAARKMAEQIWAVAKLR